MRQGTREDWLKQLKVDYEYKESIPISQIDIEKSLKNQARVRIAILPETRDSYAAGMKNGDKFPPIIVYWSDRLDAYVIIDGNHRIQAAKQIGRLDFDAYIVDVHQDALTIEILTRGANAIEGYPFTNSDRLFQAKYLVGLGTSQAEAASLMKISQSTLSDEMLADIVNKRLSDLGLEPDALNTTQKRHLNKVTDNAVLKAIYDITCEASLSAKQLNALIDTTIENSSEKERLLTVSTYRKQEEIEDKTVGKSPRKKQSTKVWTALRQVQALDEYSSIIQLGITTPNNTRRFIQQAERSINILSGLLKDAKAGEP